MLHAATPRAFPTAQLPKAVGTCVFLNQFHSTAACTFHTSQRVFNIFTSNLLRATTVCNFSSLISPDGSAPAALASLLFDPPEPQNMGKTQCFAIFFYVFPRLHLLSSDSSYSLIFFLLLFCSLLFPDSSHLCCSTCPLCRKFDF